MKRYFDGSPEWEFNASRTEKESFEPSPSFVTSGARGGSTRISGALRCPSLLVNGAREQAPPAGDSDVVRSCGSVQCCVFEAGGGMCKQNTSRSDSIQTMSASQDGAATPTLLNLFQESEVRFRRLVEAVTDYIYTVEIVNGEPARTRHCPKCETVTGTGTGTAPGRSSPGSSFPSWRKPALSFRSGNG